MKLYELNCSNQFIYLAIALHSICHPGLPFPHGDFQNGSFDFAAFHRAKSSTAFLSPFSCVSNSNSLSNFPYLTNFNVSKYTDPRKKNESLNNSSIYKDQLEFLILLAFYLITENN